MDPGPHSSQVNIYLSLVYIGLSLLLVFLNGFFVAAEFAIVKVRKTRLQELAGQGVAAARISILCVNNLDEYLSATQLGITLVSLGLGWIGEAAFYSFFSYIVPDFVTSPQTLHIISFSLSFLTITLLHVVLGELVPKSMAIQKAEKMALMTSAPLILFYKIARPMIHAFTSIANVILRLMGFNKSTEPPLSEEELRLVMKESKNDGVISESEAQIINRAFEFSDKRAIDIMVPASKVQFLSLSRPFDDNIDIIKKSLYTRFPLTSNGLNSVIGLIHMKDTLRELSGQPTNDAFKRMMRPAVFVDPKVKQDRLMKIMKDCHIHMAIVQDPATKENIGIVTLENILEELVGEIQDEHDS